LDLEEEFKFFQGLEIVATMPLQAEEGIKGKI
jgi:hypothetical protein